MSQNHPPWNDSSNNSFNFGNDEISPFGNWIFTWPLVTPSDQQHDHALFPSILSGNNGSQSMATLPDIGGNNNSLEYELSNASSAVSNTTTATMYALMEEESNCSKSSMPGASVASTNYHGHSCLRDGGMNGSSHMEESHHQTFYPTGNQGQRNVSLTDVARGSQEVATKPVVETVEHVNEDLTAKSSTVTTMSEEQIVSFGQEIIKERELLHTAVKLVKARYMDLKLEHDKLSKEAVSMGISHLAEKLGIDKLSPVAEGIVFKYCKN